jgi:DNA-binding MarR family transcriptional regulator
MSETEAGAATVPEVTELAEGLQRTLSKLFSVLRRGDTHANREAANDLTLAQLSILITLLNMGPIRMTELAAHERVRTPTTTVAIRRLEKLGLVKRSRDPSDLRAVLVEITPKGHAEHAEARGTGGDAPAARPGRSRAPAPGTRPARPPGRSAGEGKRQVGLSRRQPSQSSTAAAVQDCCILPSGSPVNGS